MATDSNPNSSLAQTSRNPALCASALSRLGAAAGALLLLWLTIAWALS